MDETEQNSGESGIALSRSRREKKSSKPNRLEALKKLRENRLSGKKNSYEVDEVQNVYDLVEEKEYAKRVRKRQEDDWIVDDDGGYVEDGREIFDDDDDDNNDPDNVNGSAKRKIRNPNNRSSSTSKKGEKSKTGNNIKNMFLSMSSTKKSKTEVVGNLDDDKVLGELLNEVTKKKRQKSEKLLKDVKSSPIIEKKVQEPPRRVSSPFVRKGTGIKRQKIKTQSSPAITNNKKSQLDSLENLNPSQSIEQVFSEDEDVNPQSNVIMKEGEDEDDDDNDNDNKVEEVISQDVTKNHRGFHEKPAEIVSTEDGWFTKVTDCGEEEESKPVLEIDPGNLPTTTTASGERIFSMYWLDAHEDPFKHPGTVWLFGKVFIKSANAYVSCCLMVRNVTRKVFLLKRATGRNGGQDVTIEDVYNEFDSKIAGRYKISEYKSRPSTKNYAFEYADVPNEAEYLEVLYSAKYPALPSDLSGETFSRVFGSNQSSLEHFLISRKIKGPCWLEVKCVSPSTPAVSWCKVEAVTENPNFVSLANSSPSIPPITILALNMKTVVNPKTLQNEVALVSALVNHDFPLDKPPPKPAHKSYFCALTRPSDAVWPFDIQNAISACNISVNKMDSERALLGFILAKIGKIDPDVILGHDITGFDLDVLLHRAIHNKIPNWSRLGRLKRSTAPIKGKIDKQILTGRLACDLKISAKELIRCKSYDLSSLIEKILFCGKSIPGRKEYDSEEMRKCYESSKDLINAINASLSDASHTLQCICDLNVLPLALQITQIAGNVMSKTLLGGRAERNEFLLLHAFHERNYIPPDKQYGRKKIMGMEDGEDIQTNISKTGRKKPSYTGGLVLEPKKGFYDRYILLMDFNSLYPSIIQEYNICFTTVKRRQLSKEAETDYIPELPDADSSKGVLPTEIRKLVESRRAVKKLLKDPNISQDQKMQYDIRQKALKLTANSMYGCLGFSHSRFYAKPLAALITSRGREILLQTKDLVEKMNLEVIYGDTDSIMINSNSRDFDEVFKLGAKIKTEVNKLYKLLELDIDGVYKYMLLLKKKKYAAVTVEKRNGEYIEATELKGLDIVRRDWSQLAADAGKYILDRIMTDIGADERIFIIHNKLESLASDLENGKITLSELVITKQLTKDPNDYPNKKTLPHVQVAIRMNSRGGKKLKSGDTVPYVICIDGSNLPAMQRAYHIDEIKENTSLKIDVQYYLAQQLYPVVSRLCDPLEGTDCSRIAQALGLNPEQYRKTAPITVNEEQELREDDKFRNCEKLEIPCKCGEILILDSIVSGKPGKKDFSLTLTTCPNTDCNLVPLDSVSLIKNKLILKIREHQHRYYAGWIVCEDPGCSGRTRQLPLHFQRAFPVCSTCGKATMYREYTDSMLYTQLLFYQQLFDLKKAREKFDRLEINGCLSRIHDGEEKYSVLYETMRKTMDLNNYSVVSLSKVFEGLLPVTAERLRNQHRRKMD